MQFSSPPIDLQGVDAQFASDVAYDQYDKTTFDIFLPESDQPTGLVIFIHGGGFTGGDKAFVYQKTYPEQLVEILSKGVAVATLNYRLIEENDTEGVLKSLNDAKRGLQYIRYIHEELNIEKDRITLFGTSAGGSTALWLATNDDMKSDNDPDPVLRESTRVKGVALRATQSSLDLETRWLGDVFVDFGVSRDDMLADFGEDRLFGFYGVSSWEEYESPEVLAYRQQVDMLAMISSDDPEIWVENTGPQNTAPQNEGDWNHHPFHAREIKEYADAAGVPNVATYGKPVLFSTPGEEGSVDFLLRKLNE
ncbi:MAG: alpha/beta hydrolase [Bacteroidota bacterium]